jgi:hypothetical protein
MSVFTLLILLASNGLYLDAVLRISWLKAKSRYERWNEELQMVRDALDHFVV